MAAFSLSRVGQRLASGRSKAGGFSLLELLLALSVAGVTAVVLYAALGIAFRARSAATKEVGAARQAAAVVETLRADFASVPIPAGVLAGTFASAGATFTTTDSAGVETALTYVTQNTQNPAAPPLGDLYEVQLALMDRRNFPQQAWLLDDAEDPDAGRCLVRIVTHNLLGATSTEAVAQLVADRVSGLTLRYFDGDAWLDEWDSTTQNNSLPGAVEVDLTLLPAGVSLSDPEIETKQVRVRRVLALPAAPTSAQRLTEALDG